MQGNLPKEHFEQLNRIIELGKYRQTKEVSTQTYTLQLPAEYKPLWIAKNTPDYRNAHHYLKQRGVTVFDILKYRIGYCEAGEYSGKIIIPSYDCDGQLNYFVSRAYYKSDKQKHKNPKVSKDVIGFDLFINWSQPIILCEGAFDAMAIKRNAIPLFGKKISTTLMKKIIKSNVEKVYLALDEDALKDAFNHAETFMSYGKRVYLIEMGDKDPSELGFETFTKLLHNATELTTSLLMKKRLALS